MSHVADLTWTCGDLRLALRTDDGPARLVTLAAGDGPSVVRPHPVVEVFVAGEHHTRATLAHTGSAVGERLRVTGSTGGDDHLTVRQHDAVTGLGVDTHWHATGPASFRTWHVLRHAGDAPVTLLAVPSLSLRTAAPAASGRYELVSGRSEWLGEGVWSTTPVRDLLRPIALEVVAQDARGRHAVVSTGGWTTGSVLPTGVLVDAAGPSLAWQVEATAGWLWELTQALDGVVLGASGPTDAEHQAALTLVPGEEFTTVPAGVAVGDGLDGAIGALTEHRRGIRLDREADRALPVVYNDYMNTLMGQPSTEALAPLIEHAAAAGAETFCIDAGWFTDARDYWGSIGVWEDAPTRFTGGLRSVTASIRAHGMAPGLWLEPEVVGLDSPALDRLPDDAFFSRYGRPTVEHHRRHLDLRHPAARAHLDEAVDRLVADHGLELVKLDYNIEPGAGTDRTGTAGQGLLGHGRALADWLRDVQERHPRLLVENCASGAQRMDHGLLAVTHVQSTSDQQDASRYAAIAAAAPMSLAPEQAGNWAYPAAGMSDGELALTLVNGLAGRLYLAGHLDRLSDAQRAVVHAAVVLHKDLRHWLARAQPCWPLGLPGWEDDVLALGHHGEGRRLLLVWSRGAARDVHLGADWADVEQVFPEGPAWPLTRTPDGLTLTAPAGPSAAAFLTPR